MPTNKNAETRYKILDQLLANRYHHYSTGDLLELVNEELVEMSMKPIKRRSIEYDLNYLEHGPFKADIEHYQIDEVSRNNPDKTVKKNCHRYRDRSFSIYQQKMNDDEKQILGEAMKLLGQFDGLPNLDRLESLRASLDIKSDRQIISFTKNPLENSNRLGELFTAISQKLVIELHYHVFAAPDEDRHTVLIPYLLKEYNRRWFLIAAAEDTGKILNFALDRIDRIVPLPGHPYVEYKGDLNERFDDIVGVTLYDDRPVQTILFWVSDRSKDYVATKPIHDSQKHYRNEKEAELRRQYPTLEGGAFFSIDCIENYELIRELISFREDLIVLSPDNIRDTVMERITAMYEMYKPWR
ncbi:MAG: WYL domain-containing protein [Bacteroidales bacterium]|nr:WYL domain-containing protein [Bacteroidales bacterium]